MKNKLKDCKKKKKRKVKHHNWLRIQLTHYHSSGYFQDKYDSLTKQELNGSWKLLTWCIITLLKIQKFLENTTTKNYVTN